jgi:hypothetical protein
VSKLTNGQLTVTPPTPVGTSGSLSGVGMTLDITYQNEIGSVDVKEYWENGYRLMPSDRTRVVFVGDGLTLGKGSEAGGSGFSLSYDNYIYYPTFNGQPLVSRNISKWPQTLQDMYDNRVTDTEVFLNPISFVNGSENIIVLWGGTDDIYFHGTSSASVYTLMQTFTTALQANGWKVILLTMISRSGVDTQKNTLNALILGGGSEDGIADLTSLTDISADGAYADTDFFDPGGLYLNSEGYKLVAGVVQTAIETLVGTFTPLVGPVTVTGLKAGNAALASLLTGLASLGLIIDSTGA